MGRGWSRMYLKAVFCLWYMPQALFFLQKMWISGFLGHAEFGEIALLPICSISALLGPSKMNKKPKNFSGLTEECNTYRMALSQVMLGLFASLSFCLVVQIL